MPYAPFRKILHTLLYIMITDCRWCDGPCGPQWASQSATHRWGQRWQADGTLATMQVRMLELAEEQGMVRWEYGATDGALSPWEGRRRGRRPRGQGDLDPQFHRRRRHALGERHHAGQWR